MPAEDRFQFNINDKQHRYYIGAFFMVAAYRLGKFDFIYVSTSLSFHGADKDSVFLLLRKKRAPTCYNPLNISSHSDIPLPFTTYDHVFSQVKAKEGLIIEGCGIVPRSRAFELLSESAE